MKNNSSTQNGLSFTTSWSHDLSTIFLFLIFSTFLLLAFKSQIQKYFSSYKLNFSFPSLQNKRSSYSKWYADFEPWKLPDPISEGFKLSESIEPKFRPFRWGPEYQVTMGIRSLDPTQWITLHSSYPSYIRLREARHSVHKSDSYRILPSNPSSVEPSDYSRNYLAALETARCVSAFLATRYPKMFQVEPKGSHLTDDGWGIKKITRSEIGEKGIETGNKLERKSWNLLDENEVLFDDDGSRIVGDNPIKTAGELIPDDLAVLLPDPVKSEEESKQTTKDRGISEEYRLIAGSICTAGFWRLKDKIGRTLREIHLNGKVPQYETRLEFPMNKFFSKLAPNKPVERNNYFFQILSTQDPLGSVSALQDGSLIPDILNHQDPESSPISGLNTMSTSISSKKDHTQGDVRDEEVKDLTELSWSHSTNGPETLFDQGTKAPKISSQENGDEDGNDELIDFKAPEPTKEKSAVVMRTERQTLRRLRRSGAIIFTIRTYIVPVTTMAEERGIPGRLASAIRSWSQDVRAYKGGELYEDVLLPYLDEKHQQQLKDGLIEGEETEREKSRKSYPL